MTLGHIMDQIQCIEDAQKDAKQCYKDEIWLHCFPGTHATIPGFLKDCDREIAKLELYIQDHFDLDGKPRF